VGEPLPEHGGVVALDSMQLTAPQTWLRKPPQIDFIVAEFLLPRAQGDPADGRLTVTTAGGTVEDNIARWRDQFGGKPEKESREKIEVGGVPITVVDFTGTYRDQRGPFAPAEERPDYRMIGAILEIGGQTYFVKGYGPAKTMAAHAEEIQAFLRSLKSGGASP